MNNESINPSNKNLNSYEDHSLVQLKAVEREHASYIHEKGQST